MKVLTTALVFFSLISFGVAANTFEGTMQFSANSESGSSLDKVTLTIKKNKVAIDVAQENAPKMVLDVSSGDLYSEIKQGAQKMIIKMNVGTLKKVGGLSVLLGSTYSQLLGQVDGADNKTTLEKTSDIKTINGYKCTKYLIKDEDYSSVIWATTDLPFDFSSLFSMVQQSENTSGFNKSIPIEGTVTDLKTKKVTNFSITAKAKSVEDSVFEFPAEYPEMDMTPLLQQLMENGDPAQIKQVLGNVLQK